MLFSVGQDLQQLAVVALPALDMTGRQPMRSSSGMVSPPSYWSAHLPTCWMPKLSLEGGGGLIS